tara:strand:+ start:10015 stop:10560 length:546 start_codon:yes stop_codon:yes gene_type:complete
MNIYRFVLNRYSKNRSTVIAFPNKTTAMNDASKGIIILNEQDLIDKTMVRLDDMVEIFNNYVPVASRIKRFSDRAAGARRLMELLSNLVNLRKIEVRKGTTSKVKNMVVESRGRKSKFDNKRILLKSEETHNPRRKGSHGFTSYQIILDNPGLTYAKFIELGGRRQDLAHDVIRKRFKVLR